ncbi:MAG: DUF6567 family protein [Luteibaculum sp.]
MDFTWQNLKGKLTKSFFGFAPLLLTSCAFHAGIMSGNAVLGDNNFEMIDMAEGRASSTRILGIGGLSKHRLAHEAKMDMYRIFH